ncbi:complexed with cef1p [Coemansia sp. Benny D115]|nr:complexed with cef1p [Coemansia sp. Benny D115]
MTTAARPTFDPAKGKDEPQFTHLVSAKALPSHTRLKTRKPGQGASDEYTVEELKRELREAERKHFESKGKPISNTETESDVSAKARYIEMAQMLDAASSSEEEEQDDGDSDNSGSESSSEDGSDGSDSEDETALLMRELEKIKRERAEEKAREAKIEEEIKLANAGSVLSSNPLLDDSRDVSVKRRWDDDVVFRNQARGDDGKAPKRFVNDMLRSDFHRKFMRKYIQ